jgi:DNA polymerase I-like protein with 3'-5' exonuclease and polymerase domains
VAEFLRMEMRGMRVDVEVLKDEIKVTDFNLSVARSQIEGLVGRKVGKAKRKVRMPMGVSEKTGRELFKTVEIPDDLNLDSPKQVLDVFAERGVKIRSTESKTLESLDDPLAETLLTYRSETKLRQFQTALLKEMDEYGIVHPNLNSNGTATGRASSGATRES